MSAHAPYSIPECRSISCAERELLQFLLEREAPSRIREIDELQIVARCGCGECPTVLFRRGVASDPLTGIPAREIASYSGLNSDGVRVGVVLIERNGELAELEAWALEGGDVFSWPAVSDLQRFPWR